MKKFNKQYFPKAHHEATYQGYDVLPDYSMGQDYLAALFRVMRLATGRYARACMFRFDLRLPEQPDCPDYPSEYDTDVISKVIQSLRAKSHARCKRKQKDRSLRHFTDIYFVWAKEINKSNQPHYHVALFVNKDVYRGFGDYQSDKDSMGSMIIEAYASALKRPVEEVSTLVHFAVGKKKSERTETDDPPVLYLDRNSEEFDAQFNRVFTRVSYLCKLETKCFGNRTKKFGSSRGG